MQNLSFTLGRILKFDPMLDIVAYEYDQLIKAQFRRIQYLRAVLDPGNNIRGLSKNSQRSSVQIFFYQK